MQPTAGARICNIAELLEHILSYLPTRDILLAQKVSNQFNATISSSQRLQHALFKLPETMKESHHIHFNPLLRHTPIFDYCNVRVPLSGPCLPFGFGRLLDHLPSEPGAFQLKDDYFVLEAWKWPHQEAAPAPPSQGTWRRMYLTQPPCDILVRVWKGDGVYDLGKRTHTMGELAGVLERAGLRIRTRLEVAVEEPISEFCVQLESEGGGSEEGSLVYNPDQSLLDAPSEGTLGVLGAADEALCFESLRIHWGEDMRDDRSGGSGSEAGQARSESGESSSGSNERGSEGAGGQGDDSDIGSDGGDGSGSCDSRSESSESEEGDETGSESGQSGSRYGHNGSGDEDVSEDGSSESPGSGFENEGDSGSESGDRTEVWRVRRRTIYGWYC